MTLNQYAGFETLLHPDDDDEPQPPQQHFAPRPAIPPPPPSEPPPPPPPGQERAKDRDTQPLDLPELGLTVEDMAMLRSALAFWAAGDPHRVKRYGNFCWRHPEFVALREEW